MEPTTSHKKTGIAIASIIVILIAATVVFAGNKKDTDQALTPDTIDTTPVVVTPSPSPTTPPSKTPPTKTTATTVYKNGTYMTSGTYMSPGGMDTVNVTLTLTNDIVTAVTVTASGDNTSQRYQEMFIAGYKQYVVGKNIASVNLTKVSGSSLTSGGFNAALAKIKAQAKV